jgi:hypothetical protein
MPTIAVDVSGVSAATLLYIFMQTCRSAQSES